MIHPSLWIFGYGSLIWKPDFPFLEKLEGYVSGWARRFYQGSCDHRGVPGAPGRVVTLVESGGQTCWGMAYRIAEEHQKKVLAQLDYREKGGYQQRFLDFHPKPDLQGEAPAQVLTYWASQSNPMYLGKAPVAEMAQQIATAHGPSGPNWEYLFHLHEALGIMGVQDRHVQALTKAVRRNLGEQSRCS